jgi:hypothetical protein
MRIAAVAFGVLLLGFIASTGSLGQTTPTTGAEKFIGTWRLISSDSKDPEVARYRGAHPTGILVYDRTGHMTVQIMPDRRRKTFTGPVSHITGSPTPTPDEAVDALMGYGAYFGTYSVDQRAGTITHKREGSVDPGALGDFVRRFRFIDADHLVLVPAETKDNPLTWERIK